MLLQDYSTLNLKGALLDFRSDKQWLFNDKAHQQKLMEFMYKNVGLYLTIEDLKHCPSLREFIKYCAYTKQMLRLNYESEVVEKLLRENGKLYKRSPEPWDYLYYYINQIASDYYSVKYKSPEVMEYQGKEKKEYALMG